MHLGPDAHGRQFGMTFAEAFAQDWLPFVPPVLAALTVRCMLRGWPPGLNSVATFVPCPLPPALPLGAPVLVGFSCLLASAAAAYALVPSGVRLPSLKGFPGPVCTVRPSIAPNCAQRGSKARVHAHACAPHPKLKF